MVSYEYQAISVAEPYGHLILKNTGMPSQQLLR
jgi:hypothetical protein